MKACVISRSSFGAISSSFKVSILLRKIKQLFHILQCMVFDITASELDVSREILIGISDFFRVWGKRKWVCYWSRRCAHQPPPPTRTTHTHTHRFFCGIRRIEQFLTYTAQYIWTQCNETDISSLCISMVLFYFQYRRKQTLAFFSIFNIEENNRWHSKTRLVVNCCVPFLHSSYYEYNDFAPRTKIRFVKEWILYDHYVPDCLLLKRRYFWKCESSYSQ